MTDLSELSDLPARLFLLYLFHGEARNIVKNYGFSLLVDKVFVLLLDLASFDTLEHEILLRSKHHRSIGRLLLDWARQLLVSCTFLARFA
jgi:hypothetical protein